MIIILASDGAATLSNTLANVSTTTFGAKQKIGLYVPPLATNENLYLVAEAAAFNASNAPVVGDKLELSQGATIGAKPTWSGQVWTVQSLMYQLEDMFPDRYNGSVHLAVARVIRSGACRDFAGMFKTLLTGERQMRGNVFFHPGNTVGPIFAAGDPRWLAVRALPVVASPLGVSKLPPSVSPTLY